MTAWRAIASRVGRRAIVGVAAAACLALAAACGGGDSTARLERAQSLESYAVPMPPMPAGTMARSGASPPFPEDPTQLRSPLSPWPLAGPALAEAASLFRIYCATCHGAEGRGDGPMAELLGVPVRDLTDSTVAELADGEIYGTITRGSGQMLGLGGLIPGERERWLLVGAVRSAAGGALRGASPRP
jgi:mono/diheme cytochrome c family protein